MHERTKIFSCLKLLSGESGSGKTVTTQLIMRFLASRNTKHSRIEQQLLEISPILEAFGNAKTIRNDNSSRFGKFVEVCFGNEEQGITGARIIQYLLEKSRIVHLAPNERNYHVFYQLLAGGDAALKARLALQGPESFFYLGQSGCVNVSGVDDAEDFEVLRSSFSFLNFSKEQQYDVYQILAVVLHLGNLKFKCHRASDIVSVDNEDALNIISNLLGVESKELRQSLLSRTMTVRGASTEILYQLHEVVGVRDALSKTLYDGLFRWLVSVINSLINPAECSNTIGILDIFGFESFKVS